VTTIRVKEVIVLFNEVKEEITNSNSGIESGISSPIVNIILYVFFIYDDDSKNGRHIYHPKPIEDIFPISQGDMYEVIIRAFSPMFYLVVYYIIKVIASFNPER
jgi:hypothetical protein